VAQRFRAAVTFPLDWALAPEGATPIPRRFVRNPRLPAFFKALPGELKNPANFPEATVEITQFEDVKKAAEGKG
jgi:hypothetical protein